MVLRHAIVVVALLALPSRARAEPPRDFTPEIRILHAVAACGEPAPAGYSAKVVDAHCAAVQKAIAAWKTNWRDKAGPFFAELLNGNYPSSVVYPFGGGDLLSLLAVYPDAIEYTTLSLEGMGDPRPIRQLATDDPKQASRRAVALGDKLAKLRKILQENLSWAWNTTDDLSASSSETGADIPGILVLTLVALEANGYEPLEARYWKPDAKGAVVPLTQRDIDAFDAATQGKKAARKMTNAVQQGAFNDIEIVFRKKGDASAPNKTFRHLTADLSDKGLEADGSALAHLEQKRAIAALTKAASYLLWKPSFGTLRGYLLAHMTQMISDDTGIPPRYAKPAGFTQEVWGTYGGSFFAFAEQDVAKEMIELWHRNTRPLAFRFGYYDNRRTPHLLHTYK